MRSFDVTRALIREPQWSEDPFSMLAEISKVCASDFTVGREFVIRALERRNEFLPQYRAILDELAVQVGLHPYVENLVDLSLRSAIAHASHRADGAMEDLVLHSSQARILRALMSGESIVLSAPTSFGKSLLIDVIISEKQFDNVVLIVPTLALVEETRRRMSRFAENYAVVTSSKQRHSGKNIFVLTQERYLAMSADMPTPDFFAIDEFYKLSITEDGGRATQLNQALLRLLRSKAQFYLLGPAIGAIPDIATERANCRFLIENFQTVAVELHLLNKKPTKPDALATLLDQLDGQTMIYCQSPASTRTVLKEYLRLRPHELTTDEELLEAADWTASNYHDQWLVSIALRHGIGIHHGRLPRSLGRFMIRAFEEKKIKILLCTSTLIEGVNTSAKNVVIYDGKLDKKPLTFFTFNNIKGRSGRMFKHFVGHVYTFDAPPEPELPFVDIPALNPTETTPSSILIQLPASQIPERLKEKVERFMTQDLLPIELLRKISGIEPEFLLDTAKHLYAMDVRELTDFRWGVRPEYDNIKATSQIIWTQMHGAVAARQSAMHTASMMTYWIWELYKSRNVTKFRRDRILGAINNEKSPKSPDEAVENVLAFLRGWASFNYPKYLSAMNDVVSHVLSRRGLTGCNYLPFAAAIENLFQPTSFASLEEYGLPFEISQKLMDRKIFSRDDDLDNVINALRIRNLDAFATGMFERRVIEDFQEGLGVRRRTPQN